MNKSYGVNVLRIAVRITILGLLLVSSANAATLTVCPSGCAYSSVQTAVNASSSGDTIQVQSGTYYENVNVNKRLTLHGIGMPVVDARGRGSAITLSTDGIILEGFNVIGYGDSWPDAGIKVRSNNNTLSGNNASSNNKYGISVDHSSNNTLLGNNASSTFMDPDLGPISGYEESDFTTIPEFPSIALPMILVVGLMLMMSRRKG